MPTIAVFVCPQTVLSSLGSALDAFALANQLAGEELFKVSKVSADGQDVSTLYATVAVDGGLALADKADLLLIPAIGQQVRAVIERNPLLLDWLRTHAAGPVQLASLCSGAFLLGAAGVLDGHRATTHWALEDRFRQAFPRVRLAIEQLVTHDGRVLCSGGAQAGLDLCLYIVRLHGGEWLARQVANALVFESGRGLQSRFVPRLPAPQVQDQAIAQLQRWLEQHFAEPIGLEAMAARIHCSPRSLSRRFKEATGLTPNDYLQRVRIAAAESELVAGSEAIERIASRVGYENRTAFAKLFKQVTGETPAAYRQRCRVGDSAHAG